MSHHDDDQRQTPFQILPAKREGAPSIIAIWGMSGAGKTRSALRLMRGMIGEAGKMVFVDTENRRALIYADHSGGFSHLDLQPPFTQERYMRAFEDAENFGANGIVVDSMSHVWAGEGGVIDQADSSTQKGLLKWKNPKIKMQRLSWRVQRSPIPAIFCIRAKDKMVQKKKPGGQDEIVNEGPMPIMDHNFIYDMTIALHLVDEGHVSELSKIPDFLKPAIPIGALVTEEMGAAIVQLMRGDKTDEKRRILQQRGADRALQGMASLKEWLGKLTPEQNTLIASVIHKLEADARAVDEAKNDPDIVGDGPGPDDSIFPADR